jgi:NAD(P)-dependent dehydrogenase (short-subunit alcohol dehydrogenase family)
MTPAGSLEGRVAIVTGGSRGIGQGIARAFLMEGARVVIAARDAAQLAESVAQLSEFGDVAAQPADVSVKADVDALVARAVDEYGRLDVMACGHGILDPGDSFLEISEADFARTVAVNLTGSFLCGQAAARAMIDCGSDAGRIVLVSSFDAIAAEPNSPGYCASKAGVHGLMKAMAVELARHRITANAIAPGWVATPMTQSSMTPEIFRHEAPFPLTPSGLLGTPDDIGRVAAFFAHPGNSYLTGSFLVVDGGQTSQLAMPA